MEPSAAAGLTDRVMDVLNNTTTNTEPLPPIREAMDTMMEHIDEKMMRLELYHRVIDGIATALGYRMGDTFEPEALVKQVKHISGLIQELRTLRLSPLTYDGENTDEVDNFTAGYNAALEDMRDIIQRNNYGIP